MRKRVSQGAVLAATIMLAATLLWSLWEWRRVSRIAVDLAKAEDLQHDISLPLSLLSAPTTADATFRRNSSDIARVILIGSSNSPLTAQSTPRWEQFLHALGAYDLTLITFDRADVFDPILREADRLGRKAGVLTVNDAAKFILTTGINVVPFTIVAAPNGKVVGLIAGLPTDATLSRVIQELSDEPRTIVGLGAGERP
jgi:hypothetical protein